MFITWKIWRALRRPPLNSPLYRRQQAGRPRHRLYRRALLVGLWLALVGGCYQATFNHPPVYQWLSGLNFFTVVCVIFALVLFYLSILTAAISLTITRAREQRIYDLLCLTPPGTLAVNWTLCAATIYHRKGFGVFWFIVTFASLILGMALVVEIAIPVLGLLDTSNTPALVSSYQRLLVDLLYTLALVGVFYVGSAQAVVSGVLLGMLGPANAPDSAGAPVWTVSSFLAVQLLTGGLAAGIGLAAVPALHQLAALPDGLARVMLPLEQFVIFAGLREATNYLLWRALVSRLESIPAIPAL
jgi:hypothetical protein